jgi:predicted ester cyclase
MFEDRKNQIRTFITEAYNQGHLEQIEKNYQPNVVCHQSLGKDLKGIGELTAYVQDLRNAYSDLKLTADEIIIEGDTAMVRGYLQGTNTGESVSLKVPATGKKMRIPFCSVTHWVNGRVSEEFNFVDLLLLTNQLGLMPARSPQAS